MRTKNRIKQKEQKTHSEQCIYDCQPTERIQFIEKYFCIYFRRRRDNCFSILFLIRCQFIDHFVHQSVIFSNHGLSERWLIGRKKFLSNRCSCVIMLIMGMARDLWSSPGIVWIAGYRNNPEYTTGIHHVRNVYPFINFHQFFLIDTTISWLQTIGFPNLIIQQIPSTWIKKIFIRCHWPLNAQEFLYLFVLANADHGYSHPVIHGSKHSQYALICV